MYTIEETNFERQHLLAAFLSPASLDALKNIQLQPKVAILDVGCGLGDTSLMLHHLFPGAHITGIDADELLIDVAKKHDEVKSGDLNFICGNALHLPFDDDYFGFVFCRFVLHHIHHAPEALKEMKRVCKPGGIVFAQEPDISLFQPYPENPAYDKMKDYVNMLFADAVIGRKLVHYFKSMGMSHIDFKAEITLSDGTSPNKRFFTLTGIALANALLKNKLLDEASLQDWLHSLKTTEEDTNAVVLSFPVISVWGIKNAE